MILNNLQVKVRILCRHHANIIYPVINFVATRPDENISKSKIKLFSDKFCKQ